MCPLFHTNSHTLQGHGWYTSQVGSSSASGPPGACSIESLCPASVLGPEVSIHVVGKGVAARLHVIHIDDKARIQSGHKIVPAVVSTIQHKLHIHGYANRSGCRHRSVVCARNGPGVFLRQQGILCPRPVPARDEAHVDDIEEG